MPLGTRGDGSATLRTETPRNNGLQTMGQQVIGGVDVEHTDTTNDQAPSSPLKDLAEGIGDVAQSVPTPRQLFKNGTWHTSMSI